MAELPLLWRKPATCFCSSTSCQCEFIWGCTACSAAHSFQEDVGCGRETYCTLMAGKWDVRINTYICVHLHGMVHVQTPNGSCFPHQRHVSSLYHSLPLLILLPLLPEACALGTLKRRQQFPSAAWQPKQKVILRDSKTWAHWVVGYHHPLGSSGSFLKSRRSKEEEWI